MGNTNNTKKENTITVEENERELTAREKETKEKTSKKYNFIFKRNNFKGHPDEDKTWIQVHNNRQRYVLEFDKLATNVPYGVIEILQQASYKPVTITTKKVQVIDDVTGVSYHQETPEMKELPSHKLYSLDFISDEDVKSVSSNKAKDATGKYNPLIETYLTKDMDWIKGRTEGELNMVAKALKVDMSLNFIKKLKAIVKALDKLKKK